MLSLTVKISAVSSFKLAVNLPLSTFTLLVLKPKVLLISTLKLFLTLVFPDVEPMLVVVDAPAKFTVAAFVLTRLNATVLTVKSPPSILTSPFTVRSFLI